MFFKRKKKAEEEEVKDVKVEAYKKKSIKDMESIEKNRKIITILKKIKDPELDIDIWTLGLIYDITIKNDKVDIVMTFTSPYCPFGPQLLHGIEDGLNEIKLKSGIEVIFNPMWEPNKELREMLGL